MFVQFIEGRTSDREALRDQFERWDRELRPGAVGFLGSTGGLTEDGAFFVVARFADAESARRNSERPEQGEWWAATERLCDGPVTFHDSEDVHVMTHGDPDEAHFVQIMEGHVTDRSRADELERASDPMLAELRPDVLGMLTAYFDEDSFAEVVYFSSEHDARRGERQEMTGEAAEMVDEWTRVMNVERYLDIKEPWLSHS